MERILVTGSSGFIGMHLCESLLKDGFKILGIDNMNSYYDIELKKSRLNKLKKYKKFTFNYSDIIDYDNLEKIFKEFRPQKVVNLAAQAGVRYSLKNPHEYIQSNIVGFMNILELSRLNSIEGLIYASSSSVYGDNKKTPFSVDDIVDSPISIYAATKKSNELMARVYNSLFGLHSTGLRFFTVYGPWGRPDMAMYIFAKNMMNNQNIPVFNHGNMKRDFTYIDDIVRGIRSSIDKNYSYEIFNLGNNKVEKLIDVINLIETSLSKKAKINFMDIQLGDVEFTYADIVHSQNKLGYNPKVAINEGIPKFISWFNSYNKN